MSGSADKSAEPTPVYPQPIFGWRIWLLAPGGKLFPLTGGSIRREDWRAGIVRSECLESSSHREVPVDGCGCGFHAYYKRAGAEMLARENEISNGPSLRDGLILGLICAGGRVRMHRDGFRAEYAQILMLLVPSERRDSLPLARALRDRYQTSITGSLQELDQRARSVGI